jgi:hypothetical protein
VPVLKDSQAKRLEAALQQVIAENERHRTALLLFWNNFDEVANALLDGVQEVADGTRKPPALARSAPRNVGRRRAAARPSAAARRLTGRRSVQGPAMLNRRRCRLHGGKSDRAKDGGRPRK